MMNQLVAVVHLYLLLRILEDFLRKYIATRKKITPLINSPTVCSKTRNELDASTNPKLININNWKQNRLIRVTFLKPFFVKPLIFNSNANIIVITNTFKMHATIKKISLQHTDEY
jgi:hypothetical protein